MVSKAYQLKTVIGKTFHLIKHEEQIKILDLTTGAVHSYFGSLLFRHIKDPISNKDTFEKIWQIGNKRRNGTSFANNVFELIGKNFCLLRYEDQLNVLNEFKQDISFHTWGLAEGLGEKYHLISNETTREKVLEIARQNTEFARGLGRSLCRNFPYMTQNMQEKILDMDMFDSDFLRDLSNIISQNYLHLSEKTAFPIVVLQATTISSIFCTHIELLLRRTCLVQLLT